jgi:hypothetical protein
MNEEDEVVSIYKYSAVIRDKTLEIPDFKLLTYSENLLQKVGNNKMIDVPLLLIYMGIKIINNIEGYQTLTKLNCEIPEWFEKTIIDYRYPGDLLKELVNGCISV